MDDLISVINYRLKTEIGKAKQYWTECLLTGIMKAGRAQARSNILQSLGANSGVASSRSWARSLALAQCSSTHLRGLMAPDVIS